MKARTYSYYLQVVRSAVDHTVDQLDDALDLRQLAARARLSPFHFHRIFRGMVGETPLELSRRLRMERAAWRLIHTNQSITRIGFDAGFETHEGFTRSFRSLYGISPSGFRRRKYPRIELAAACGIHFTGGNAPLDFIPRNTGGASMDVQIKEMPEKRVGAVRHVGPYNQIPEAFEQLGPIAGRAGLLSDPAAMMVAIYRDDPDSTPAEELRSDAGLVVSEGITLPAELTEHWLPAGRYASTIHRGSYTELGDTWARFMGEWLPSSGHRLGEGPSYEHYLNTPGTVAEEELLTEINIPID